MKPALAAAFVFLAGEGASAHRLDEYLQGTLLTVEKNRLEGQMTLTPGVAVFRLLVAAIDSDGNGVISEKEQQAYAQKVLHDLTLEMDGDRLTPQLLSVRFSSVEEMKEGRGEIQISFGAELPRGWRSTRKLVFENHHQNRIAAYQVNCLVPRDPDIRIAAQQRDYSQSVYRLDYVQADVRSLWSGVAWLGAVPVLLFTRLAYLWRRARRR